MTHKQFLNKVELCRKYGSVDMDKNTYMVFFDHSTQWFVVKSIETLNEIDGSSNPAELEYLFNDDAEPSFYHSMMNVI